MLLDTLPPSLITLVFHAAGRCFRWHDAAMFHTLFTFDDALADDYFALRRRCYDACRYIMLTCHCYAMMRAMPFELRCC